MSIPVPEEVPKWLVLSLPDAGSGWTFTCHVPPHAFEMSSWSDFTPCVTVRCYCGMATSHDISTTPKVASVVNVPPYAWSSHSSEGTAWASLDQDEALEDDFQTQHTPVHRVMWQEDNGHRSSAEGRLECSGGSPGQQTGYHIDIGEEEEMLETVDPTWQTTHWLHLAVQGISDDEVPWYEFITLLTTGAEGVAISLAKRLLTICQWSIRVQGWDICLPTPTVLNIEHFMMRGEVQGDVDNSLWFEAYSCTLQRVREATHGRCWQWPKGKAWEVGVSPLVRVFWEETGIELAASCTRLCWELLLRGVFRRRERGTISHVITFLDDMAVHIPMLDAWDQFVWLPSVAVPQAAMEVEQHGYHHGHAVDLSPVMPVMEFWVMDEEGTYLCVAWVLIFEGSILAYNPARDEVEWVPTCSITNDLSWVEERSAFTLANFFPHAPHKVAHIAELERCCLTGWLDESSEEEEGNDDGQEEKGDDDSQEEEGDDDGQVEEGDYGDG